MSAKHTFPADAPLWLTIWPNGEAAHYTSLKELAEASERYMVSPAQMIVLLEDGSWRDCDDDVIEELGGIHHLIASTGRTATVDFVCPPIPSRKFDYMAYFSDDEPDDDGNMLVGWGDTELSAFQSLYDAWQEKQ